MSTLRKVGWSTFHQHRWSWFHVVTKEKKKEEEKIPQKRRYD